MSPVLGALGVGARAFGLTASTGAATSYDLLTSSILTSATATISIDTSAYSAYKHLQLRMTIRDTNTFAGGAFRNVGFRFNSDTGSNYTDHWIMGYTGSAVVGENGGTSSILDVKYGSLDDTATTGVWASTVMDIVDFGNTSKNKTLIYMTGNTSTATSSVPSVVLGSGLWASTAAITSIQIYAAVEHKIGSRFSLYGVKG